jgi:secreted PhoX family phosphatase
MNETVRALHKRYGVRDEAGWGRHYDRFDVKKEPHEPLRFGCVVEIDPYEWVATDGQASSIKKNDAVYVVEVGGPHRGMTKMFMTGVPGGEICGPEFTPDNRTFFVAIQHPGEGKESTLANPISRFPDYKPDMPPRPSVVAIYRIDGGKVGS